MMRNFGLGSGEAGIPRIGTPASESHSEPMPEIRWIYACAL
jgi:hypothetical protein